MISLVPMFAASALAAFLTCLDTATKSNEPLFALRTKEWWILLLINGGVAFLILYAAKERSMIDPSSVLGFFSAAFGYPLLLHTKLFSIRGNTPEDDKSVGPQFLLELADRVCLPGIRDSIDEMAAALVLEWRQADMARLGESTKDYLNAHSWPQNSPRSKQDVLSWVDKLITDTTATPGNADNNARALFLQIQEIGGLRGARWVLEQSTNR